MLTCCLDAVAHGAWVCVGHLRPHLESPVETTAVAHGGNPQDRTASPVPLLHRLFKS
ncbi:MAG: hypothetical protein F6J98_17020 [Moorea sp. SIO4G2]|nr:hypothetical protein [Moorena sp. SIO4G2]